MPDEPWSSGPPSIPPIDRPPEGSTIEVVEANAARLVLFIPAGPKRGRELGCFGLIWTTIISIITAAFVFTIRQPVGPGIFVFLFLTPFWLAGLGMLYFALRMRHTRTLVLVEPARAVLQKTFLGRTKTREAQLVPGEGATLVESYRQNDVPIDAVCLKGETSSLKFGTPLEPREKTWLVDRINLFLGVAPASSIDPAGGPMPTIVAPTVCRACGGDLPDAGNQEGEFHAVACPFCGDVNSPLLKLIQTAPSDTEPAAGDFPTERITIVDQTPDQLAFEMRVFESTAMRRSAAVVFLLFSLVWNSIVAVFVWEALFGARFNLDSVFMLIFMLPFIAIGVVTLCATFFVLAGRLRVQMDRTALRASWQLGSLGYSRSLPTESITHVTVENSPMAAKNRRPRSSSDPDTRMAMVWAGDRWIPVTMLQGVNDCRHVAALVRGQLFEMGLEVADQRTPVSITLPLDDDEDNDDEVDED